MLKKLSLWETKNKTFPTSLFSWKQVLGNDVEKIVGWLLTYTDNPVFSIEANDRSYECKHWGESEILCVDEFSRDEIRIPKNEAIELTFDKEAFAREVSSSIGFERTILEHLKFTDAYYLGTLLLKSHYAVYIFFDFFNAEKFFKCRIKENSIPIIYCFSERNMTAEFRKMIEDARGKILLIKDHFQLGSRKLKNINPIEKIFAYRRTLRGEEGTHNEYKLKLPNASEREWKNILIEPDGKHFVKIKYFNNESYDLRYSDIAEFRIGQPPEYKPSALWEFFISTLFSEGADFDSNENSADSKKRKALTKILKRYFAIEKPPYKAMNGRLYPTFRVRHYNASENPKIRFDKRRVSFDERYHSV